MAFNLQEMYKGEAASAAPPISAIRPGGGEIALDDIIPDEENAAIYSIDNIDTLAESIRAEGLQQDILVHPRDGKYELISGHRRWTACKWLRDKYGTPNSIRAKFDYEENIWIRKIKLITANSTSRILTPYQQMMQYVHLDRYLTELKKANMLEGSVRQNMVQMFDKQKGNSSGQIGRLLSIYKNLQPELMEHFKKDHFGIAVACELAGCAADEQNSAAGYLRGNWNTIPLDMAKYFHNESKRKAAEAKKKANPDLGFEPPAEEKTIHEEHRDRPDRDNAPAVHTDQELPSDVVPDTHAVGAEHSEEGEQEQKPESVVDSDDIYYMAVEELQKRLNPICKAYGLQLESEPGNEVIRSALNLLENFLYNVI